MPNLIDIIDDATRDLSAQASPDITADYTAISQASDSTPKKVLLQNLVGTVLAALRSAFTPASSSAAASLAFAEDTDNGAHKITVTAPAAIASDKTLTLPDETGTLATVGKQTIWVPASAMTSATTSGAAAAQIETSSNKVNIPVLDFDASADEYAHFNIAMPKGWDEGTLTFRARWCSSATDTDGVAWGLEAVAVSDNESLDAAWGTAVVVTDDAQSAANEQYTTSESSALTVGGSPAVGDHVYFRAFRDVSDANDDMSEDARLIGYELFYTTNSGNDA